ncbi:MAG: hypothetical protein VCE74_12335 [Alphaproteobacteria bacterium]
MIDLPLINGRQSTRQVRESANMLEGLGLNDYLTGRNHKKHYSQQAEEAQPPWIG